MEPLMRHPTVAVGDLSGIRSSAFPGTCGPGFRGINGNLPRAGPTIYSKENATESPNDEPYVVPIDPMDELQCDSCQ
jgi:hypothetical protein